MAKPPIIHEPGPPGGNVVQPAWVGLVIGLMFVLAAVLHEWLSNPVVPIWQYFQLIPISIGLGVAVALLQKKYSWGLAGWYVAAAFLVFQSVVHQLSALPVLLFLGTARIVKFVLVQVQD